MLEGVGPKILSATVIVLTIALIGVGVYTVFIATQHQEQSLTIRLVGDITVDPNKYVGQRITVQGYYYQGDFNDGYGYITDAPIALPFVQGSLNGVNFLTMNFSQFNITFSEGVLYYFTGILQVSQNPVTQITSYSLLLKALEQP
ncbi:MAG TPA: hypothetical protein VMT57_06140 [Candidatus Thermoplasmatota archaeon]|nr:hypothetical protein [Candidatus Thermoplasmatota archaeon]